MEVKLLVCGVLLVSFMVTGSDAQLDVCGIVPLNTRIVGGNDAPAGSWPWQVYVHDTRAACGGSLINNQWVLTSAHCFTSTVGLKVYFGVDALQAQNPNMQFRTVSQLINHPNYNDIPFNNDIALLQLSSPVNFTDYIRPVCLAADGSVFNNGKKVWVTGWGRIQEGVSLPFPRKLQEVSVPIVSNSQCQTDYDGIINIMSNMICAGLDDGGKGPCNGDSGGPLVVQNGKSKWIQGGVVSFGLGCARPGFPGVFARVSKYQSWINRHITRNQPGFITFEGDGSSGAARPVSSSVPQTHITTNQPGFITFEGDGSSGVTRPVSSSVPQTHITTNQPGFITFEGDGSSGVTRPVSLSVPLMLSISPAVFSLFGLL